MHTQTKMFGSGKVSDDIFFSYTHRARRFTLSRLSEKKRKLLIESQ